MERVEAAEVGVYVYESGLKRAWEPDMGLAREGGGYEGRVVVSMLRACRGIIVAAGVGWYWRGDWCGRAPVLGSWGGSDRDSVTAEMGWKEDMALCGFQREGLRASSGEGLDEA